MADISEGSVPLGQMRLSITKGGVGWRPPGGGGPQVSTYTCPVHGTVTQSDSTWCAQCMNDAFEKLGIQKVERSDG